MANTFRKSTLPPRKQTSSPPPKPIKAGSEQLTIDFKWNKEYSLVAGVVLIIISGFLLLSFLSYWFAGEADQDIVQHSMRTAMNDPTNKAHNIMGLAGAYISDWFTRRWFGFAAFGFLPILFFSGYKLVFERELVPLNRFVIGSIFYIFWVSIFLGYFVRLLDLPVSKICGGLGYSVNEFLYQLMGFGGIIAIVLALILWLVFFHGYTQIDDYFFATFFHRKPTESSEFEENDDEENEQPSPRKSQKTTTELVETEDEQEEIEEEKGNFFEKVFNNTTEKPATDKSSLGNKPFNGGITFTVEDTTKVEHKVEEEIETPPFEIIDNDDDDDKTNEELLKNFGLYDSTLDLSEYQYPPLDLLTDYDTSKFKVTDDELEANKNRIVDTLRNYQIGIASIKATIGPTVTLYEIVPEAGVRISKIKNLEDDIALNLAALGIRIIAPMPGKGTIGIEVPNKTREMVSMKSVLMSEKFQKNSFDLPIILGKSISNEIYVADLAKMPHLLMAGATGQGKSVGLNVILVSLLYKKHPSQIKFILVDPKKVELALYSKIERHFLAMLPEAAEAIITDTKKVVYTLNSLCIEMDNRYNLLKDAGVRNLKEYNAKFIQRRLNPEKGHRYLPYIVLVIDELADLMMTAGKEVEQPIARLAQLARAIGIHLIVATQRPSVNVITGLIKANFPARLSFKVTSKIDSRTILDTGGSEQLVGNGDMLLSTGSDMIRLQCPFVDTPEVEEICEFIGSQRGYESAYLLPEFYGDEGPSEKEEFDSSELDPLFDESARLLVIHQQGSTSLIQRKMKLGYNRAGRIIDQLEQAGIVGPFEGSKAREVLIKDLEHLEEVLRKLR